MNQSSNLPPKQTRKQTLKQTIEIAAYGWSHEHWSVSYYPDDLPEDWRLSFYSNEFNAVMVPSDYWSGNVVDCEQWLDDVHENFSFYVQCSESMFAVLPMHEMLDQLTVLQPQLAALVFDGDERKLAAESKAQMIVLAESLDVELVGINLSAGGSSLWRYDVTQQAGRQKGSTHPNLLFSNIACIKNELNDLREVRAVFEKFISQLGLDQPCCDTGTGRACIIVDHPQLQAENINRARSLLEIMGH